MLRCLNKQTIDISNKEIDEKTLTALERADKYKLFKISFHIDVFDVDRTEIIYSMLNRMPELEIDQIKIVNEINSTLHNLVQNRYL